MSVRQQLLATLIACLSITLGATFVLHLGQQNETAEIARSFAKERQEQLDGVVRANTESLGLFVDDYSGWDEMVRFANSLDQNWARLNIVEVMERFKLGAVWLVGSDGRILYSANAPGAEDVTPPPGLDGLIAARAWATESGGYYRLSKHTIEVRMRPVQPTADIKRETTPAAWLLAARPLDQSLMDQFARQLQASVSLHEPGLTERVIPEGQIIVHHALVSHLDDRPVAELHATFRIAALELGEHYNRSEMLVGVCSGALLLGVVGWSINRNVLRPLTRIGESLEKDSPEPLAGMPAGLPEFTRIADLVRQSFAQREALRHEIAERARLGRDLHDGVIQNLYATGLGLAQAQRTATTDPGQTITRLEQTRRTLNQTMEALRGFIARAEPEASGPVDFADSCVTLFQTLRAHRACELDLDVDTKLAARLSAQQQANLLLIIREAISNALRHGEARRIAVALHPDDSRADAGRWARLSVCDNGRGFDPSVPLADHEREGHGMNNIRVRAGELGGTAEFSINPNGGSELKVIWPWPEKA